MFIEPIKQSNLNHNNMHVNNLRMILDETETSSKHTASENRRACQWKILKFMHGIFETLGVRKESSNRRKLQS